MPAGQRGWGTVGWRFTSAIQGTAVSARAEPGKGSLMSPIPPISQKVVLRRYLGCWVLHTEQW